jgi:hypothetical protein
MLELSDSITRKFVKSFDISNFEIDTDTGWVNLNKIHKTIDYEKWSLSTTGGLQLDAADTHIVFDHDLNQVFVKDLIPMRSKIMTESGPQLVATVVNQCVFEPMFDLTVDSPNHRFYSNGILSHNTTIINALSYAMFGNAISNIRKDNLINRTNAKNMLVTVEFAKDGVEYKIERGRKPTVMKLWVGGDEKKVDDAQGDSRETQAELERIYSMSHDMFKHILALNTYTEPFLSMRANDQRMISEQLLGITLLSEKADKLKDQIKISKDAITQEEFRIKAVTDANKRVEEQIENLRRRERVWVAKHTQDINDLQESQTELGHIDIAAELIAHRALTAWTELTRELASVNKYIKQCDLSQVRELKLIDKLKSEVNLLKDHKCYACGSDLHDDAHSTVLASKEAALQEAALQYLATNTQLLEHTTKLGELGAAGTQPKVYYDNENDAVEHRSSIAHIQQQLLNKQAEQDPYSEQIQEMCNVGIESVTYDEIEALGLLRDHQEMLYKLLSNKDSFIRKQIIDQNLSYLNIRLGYYLGQIGLPHTVKFNNDLSVTIEELGRELDFDNLSRGERNRLILSLSWAFRDVWESLYQKINLLFIDELIDNGLDASGIESALAILKKTSREQKKSIWLVSHKDELVGRVNNTLHVVKSNGFTEYSTDTEISEVG